MLVILQWAFRLAVPAADVGVIGSLACGVAILLWWLFLSRAAWADRLGAIAVMAASMYATSRLLHESIAKGAMGMLFPVLALPVLSLAFVAWAMASRRLSQGLRRASMVVTILLACGTLTLLQTGGFDGNFKNDLRWRWSQTPEEKLVAAEAVRQPAPVPAAVAAPAKLPPAAVPAVITAEWHGLRGPRRDGILFGVRIKTDWSATPPAPMWRRPVGPGWSSFAVNGDYFYTQEQRGPDEVVTCYRLTTGEPVWTHRDAARFWESNAGAGPRATPTFSNGRVYTLGATGILNALNAADGSVVWSRNAVADTGAKIPDWGISGSPLVTGDAVIAAASGRLAAYDLASGTSRWTIPRGGASYSSPQLLTIDGVPQVLMLNSAGAFGVALSDGTLLWEHKWEGYPIVQPAFTADGDILMSVSDSSGTRRVGVARESGGWTVRERWTSTGLKPYFNDFVVHDGHAFGFDGNILACIDLKDGKRKWKGGRYGYGQMILLPDQNLLLLLSEQGELALVAAATDKFTEIARLPGIEGKTWNHPVLAGGVMLVRNAQEMAAFRLSFAR
ncbi:MAG: PQQ-like beta-propeller repeat protein [Candidatus Solibacter usitatus]|nr:PQQ-like beta-propeller repeat protein [Candidatus Solibacter usitatus]